MNFTHASSLLSNCPNGLSPSGPRHARISIVNTLKHDTARCHAPETSQDVVLVKVVFSSENVQSLTQKMG
jgi:hypothetical protein